MYATFYCDWCPSRKVTLKSVWKQTKSRQSTRVGTYELVLDDTVGDQRHGHRPDPNPHEILRGKLEAQLQMLPHMRPVLNMHIVLHCDATPHLQARAQTSFSLERRPRIPSTTVEEKSLSSRAFHVNEAFFTHCFRKKKGGDRGPSCYPNNGVSLVFMCFKVLSVQLSGHQQGH